MAEKFTDGHVRKFSDGRNYYCVYMQPGEYQVFVEDKSNWDSWTFFCSYSGVKSSPDLIARLEKHIEQIEAKRAKERWVIAAVDLAEKTAEDAHREIAARREAGEISEQEAWLLDEKAAAALGRAVSAAAAEDAQPTHRGASAPQ